MASITIRFEAKVNFRPASAKRCELFVAPSTRYVITPLEHFTLLFKNPYWPLPRHA